jgi:RimK family alpha-L-glutamate ligase
MKIIILHHDLEETEIKIKSFLEERGMSVSLLDIRNVDFESFKEVDIVLNRVYASVANRDYKSIQKTLKFLKLLEEKGIYCWNSYKTTLYDYNKFESYRLLKANNIPTPETLFIGSKNDISLFVEDASKYLGFPMIVKRNSGGRGKDVSKVNSNEELKKDLLRKFKNAEKEGYEGGFIAQEFIHSSKSFDCRLGVIDSKIAFHYGRTLISIRGGKKWLASVSKGSKRVNCDISEIENDLGLKVSRLINSDFNVVDLMFTEKGPVVIENNPTPNYNPNSGDVFKEEDFLEAIYEGLKYTVAVRTPLLTKQ